jgi:4-alpha-glucanotransferase
MTDDWGIDAAYQDAYGAEQTVDPAVVERLREIVGRPPDTEPPVLFRRPGGELPGPGLVELEDGGERRVEGRLPAEFPLGYHRLHRDGRPVTRLIVTPGSCHLPPGRGWGWVVQLYATRSRDSWGIGDLGDLARWCRHSAQQWGADFVLVNPMHATAPTPGQQASPYYPATRRFRNPLYLRIEDIPGATQLDDLPRLAKLGQALNERREIDRDAVWQLKLQALEQLWEHAREVTRPAPSADLEEFATWAALTEQFGANWQQWPPEYRHPHRPAVAEFAAAHADRVRFHGWLQELTAQQFAAAAEPLAIIQDLPIGVDPGGADAWAWQDLLALEVSVGAPPDEFNTAGQNWGLPPFVPWRLAHAGYQPFIDTIRAGMAGHGGLRIDHVMGLFRLWWIPDDAGATDGAYVRYPSDDLLDIIALESHRAQALVVGEDLGTVEQASRDAMAERNMLSYRLLWFEQDDPATWPQTSLAAVTTHDLPTVAGLWGHRDLHAQRRAGVTPNEESTRAIRERLASAGGLSEQAPDTDAVLAAHRLLARAPAVLLAATLDDAVAEPERPNIPGGDGQRPNWSLALPVPLEELQTHPLVNEVAGTLAEATAPVRQR